MDSKIIKQHYDDNAGEFHNQLKAFNQRLLNRIKIPKNKKVLDVGCGAGSVTFEIYNRTFPKHMTGIDISENLIDIANNEKIKRGINNISFIQGDAEALHFEDNSFDCVVSNMVFHLLNNQFKALSEMHRVIKPGCSAALTFQGQRPIAPEYFILLSEVYKEVLGNKEFPDYFNILTIDEISSMVEKIGIESFEINWSNNISHMDIERLKKYLRWLNTVTGFWRQGLNENEIEEIEKLLKDKIKKQISDHGTFKLSWSNIVLLMIKRDN